MTSVEIPPTVDELAARLLAAPADTRYIVVLAGVPGSGKSYLSRLLGDAVDAREPGCAIVLPLDGFHLSRAQLSTLPDPAEALKRRGAHWTFDGARFISYVRRVRERPDQETQWPSFDHAVGDPVENAIRVGPQHRIVIVEGLYAHVSQAPWRQIDQLADELWWVEAQSAAERRRRLVARHMAAGLAADPGAAEERIDTNDDLNGAFAESCRLPSTLIIPN